MKTFLSESNEWFVILWIKMMSSVTISHCILTHRYKIFIGCILTVHHVFNLCILFNCLQKHTAICSCIFISKSDRRIIVLSGTITAGEKIPHKKVWPHFQIYIILQVANHRVSEIFPLFMKHLTMFFQIL